MGLPLFVSYINLYADAKSIDMSKKKMREFNGRLIVVEKIIKDIALKFEQSHFYDYMNYVSNEKHIIRRAFKVGIAKGIGSAIGFTLLGALVVYILHLIAQTNLPYIADFISKIIRIIENG